MAKRITSSELLSIMGRIDPLTPWRLPIDPVRQAAVQTDAIRVAAHRESDRGGPIPPHCVVAVFPIDGQPWVKVTAQCVDLEQAIRGALAGFRSCKA